MSTLRGVIRKYMAILEKYHVFFKDPIYFRITPLRVDITYNISPEGTGKAWQVMSPNAKR